MLFFQSPCSALLRRLRDEHPEVPCLAAAVAPSATSASQPAASAYSAALCLADVADASALTLWLDNAAFAATLASAAAAPMSTARHGFGSLNALAAAALAAASACHRLRGVAQPPCDVAALCGALVPYPRLHVAAPALAPAAWLAARCLEADAAASAGAPAEASTHPAPPPTLPSPQRSAAFPLERRLVAEMLAPRSLLIRADGYGGPSASYDVYYNADEPPPLRGRVLAGALLLRGDDVSVIAASAAAARAAAMPGAAPVAPWAAAGAAPAAPLLCAVSPAPASWRAAAGAPPGGAAGCALVNGTFVAASLAAAAARFGAAYRRRAHAHLFTQEGLTGADMASAAERLLDWADEYAQFDAPHDVALASSEGGEGEYEYSDEEWRGGAKEEGAASEAPPQAQADEETPEAVRGGGGAARTLSPPWLREALRRGAAAETPEADVSTVSERGSEARADEV